MTIRLSQSHRKTRQAVPRSLLSVVRGAFAPAMVLLLAFLVAVPAFSQTTMTSGTIKGYVVDPQNAPVPGAQIQVINTLTNATRNTQTDDSGNFTVADLPVGAYSVKVQKQGFKVFDARNVVVNVSNITTVTAKLDIGSVQEEVTVEANALQVQTSSAAVGEVVSGEQVANLPLNGGNFVQLTLLQPGVSRMNNFSTTNKGLIGGVDFSVNGNPVTNNLFLIDGANNNDVGSNRTILTYPSVDAIAEFKMLRNSYGPEYGQASGAVISIVTKSGTNQFHGAVNYLGRNDAVMAEDYFAKQANDAVKAAGGQLPHNGKDELRRNDIEYAIGGPVVKNKIFFFWSQEFNREIQGYTRSACVPTTAELGGNFSALAGGATDGCGGTAPTIPVAAQAPGNPLKIANPSPEALLILSQFPAPNAAASAATNFNNWFASTPSPLNWREENARGDFHINNNETVTLRYTQDNWTNNAPNLANSGYLWGEDGFASIEGNWAQPSRSAIAKLTSVLSSTMVNEAQFSYAGNAIETTPGGYGTASPWGTPLAGSYSGPGLAAAIEAGLPTIFPRSGKGAGGIPTFWGGAFAPYTVPGGNMWTITPYHNNMDLYTVRDDLSKVIGNHSLKAGVYLSWNSKNEDQYGGQDQPVLGSAASWAVGTNTGNQLANFLLPGQVFNGVGEQNVNPTDLGRWRDYEFYVGDTWKISPRVTMEYGFRWSFLRNPYDSTNAMGIFNPSAYNPATALVGSGQPNLCDGIMVVPGTNFCQAAAASTGIPYTNGTPSPYGRSLQPQNNHLIAPRLGLSWDVFGDGKTAIRAGVGQFFQRERVSIQVGLTNSLPFVLNATSNRTLDAAPTTFAYGGAGSNSLIPTTNVPNSWQWNFMVEHELYRDTALEVGYIGNKGTHLTTILDQNAVVPDNRQAGLFATSAGALNAVRPYNIYGSIYAGSRSGWSTYNGLQALFRTKIPNILNFQAAYTWSHSISDNVDLGNSSGLGGNNTNISDPYNGGLDKGNSSLNRPQMFVANAVWYLPKFSGAPTMVRAIFGGWENSDIWTFEDGNSITVWANGGAGTNAGTAGLWGTGYAGNVRPLIVPGQSCNGNQHGDTVLNINAFTFTGLNLGTDTNPLIEPRGYCSAPSLQDWDFALYKDFKLTERFVLQFRFDFFNFLNHVNFRGDQINTDFINNGNATIGCAAGACGPGNTLVTSTTTPTINNFGAAYGDVQPRELQYGVRLTF